MYESNHVNKGVEVEHDKHHLITGQLFNSLTDMRETTNDVNGSQGTVVQSIWFE